MHFILFAMFEEKKIQISKFKIRKLENLKNKGKEIKNYH
jgi:hypothetical protein